MARKSSNDKSQIRNALAVFKEKGTLTPSELCAAAGVGLKYASKFASWLRHYGHDITTNKSGKTVVSYTYVGETDRVKPLPSAAPKAPKVKTAKPVKKVASVKPVMSDEEIKEAAAALQKLRNQGSSSKGASYSIDPDWDAVEDVRELL